MYVCSGRKVYQPTEIGFFRSVPVRALTTGDFHMLALCDVAGSGGVDSGTDRYVHCMYVCMLAYMYSRRICCVFQVW